MHIQHVHSTYERDALGALTLAFLDRPLGAGLAPVLPRDAPPALTEAYTNWRKVSNGTLCTAGPTHVVLPAAMFETLANYIQVGLQARYNSGRSELIRTQLDDLWVALRLSQDPIAVERWVKNDVGGGSGMANSFFKPSASVLDLDTIAALCLGNAHFSLLHRLLLRLGPQPMESRLLEGSSPFSRCGAGCPTAESYLQPPPQKESGTGGSVAVATPRGSDPAAALAVHRLVHPRWDAGDPPPAGLPAVVWALVPLRADVRRDLAERAYVSAGLLRDVRRHLDERLPPRDVDAIGAALRRLAAGGGGRRSLVDERLAVEVYRMRSASDPATASDPTRNDFVLWLLRQLHHRRAMERSACWDLVDGALLLLEDGASPLDGLCASHTPDETQMRDILVLCARRTKKLVGRKRPAGGPARATCTSRARATCRWSRST